MLAMIVIPSPNAHNRWSEISDQIFAVEGVQPCRVLYEELDGDPIRTASGVLGFLGLDLPAGREITVRHKRLADDLNARWIESYHLHQTRERTRP